MRAISGCAGMGASARSLGVVRAVARTLCAGLLTACGGHRPAAIAPSATQIRVLPLEAVVMLQSSAPVPRDTTVMVLGGEPRVIVLRQAPPENIVYAELHFTAGSFASTKGRPVRVTVRPRAGAYGLDVRASAGIGAGASIVFKYPRYFTAPAGGADRYANTVELERALAVGRVLDSARIALLPSTRPAADNLQAPLPAEGLYLVAAEK